MNKENYISRQSFCLNPRIKFKKTHPDAKLPSSKDAEDINFGDTGYDLYSVEDTVVPKKGSVIVNVGLMLADMHPGIWVRIEPRSGLGFKSGIQPHLGVIDNGYRGDMGVKLYNFSDEDYSVNVGDRIAQLVVYPLFRPRMEWSDDITNSDRGDSGFGSTGK